MQAGFGKATARIRVIGSRWPSWSRWFIKNQRGI